MNVSYGKAIGAGVAVGLVVGLASSVFTFISFLCCIANMVGYLGPAFAGVGASAIGAGLQSTAATEPGKEALQGLLAGSVASITGALTCAIVFGLAQFIYPVFMTLLIALDGKSSIGEAIGAGIFTAMWAAVIALGVGVMSSIGGLIGGAITGAIVGAVKGAVRN